jgi:hypothetical protein
LALIKNITRVKLTYFSKNTSLASVPRKKLSLNSGSLIVHQLVSLYSEAVLLPHNPVKLHHSWLQARVWVIIYYNPNDFMSPLLRHTTGCGITFAK